MTQPDDDGPGADSSSTTIDNQTWEKYLRTMTAWAMRALRHVKETTGDFNDVVSSALRTHQRRQQEGVEPPPENATQLWDLLKHGLNRKIAKYRQAGRSRKNQVLREGDWSGETDHIAWEQSVIDANPSPEDLDAYVHDALGIVRETIEDPQLHEIARLTMMSYSPAEIGGQLNLSIHQVRRRLDDIRKSLQRELDNGD